MTQPRGITKKYYQQVYWLKKAIEYGIETTGRELDAAHEAEARYRREYRAKRRAMA